MNTFVGGSDFLYWKQQIIDDTIKQLDETGKYKSNPNSTISNTNGYSIDYILKNYWQFIAVGMAALIVLIKD